MHDTRFETDVNRKQTIGFGSTSDWLRTYKKLILSQSLTVDCSKPKTMRPILSTIMLKVLKMDIVRTDII